MSNALILVFLRSSLRTIHVIAPLNVDEPKTRVPSVHAYITYMLACLVHDAYKCAQGEETNDHNENSGGRT